MYPKHFNGDTAFGVEYSISQDAFHIDNLHKLISINLQMLGDNISNDYKLVAIADTLEHARSFAQKIREIIEQKKIAKLNNQQPPDTPQ